MDSQRSPAVDSSAPATDTWVRPVDRVVGGISRTASLISAVAIIVMMFLMVSDVILRFQTGRPVAGAYETVQVLVVLIVFLGLAHSERGGHTIRVTVLTAVLSRAAGEVVRMTGRVLTVAIAIWLTYATALHALNSFERGEYTRALVDFPVWPAKALVFIGCALLTLELVLNIFTAPQKRVERERAEGVSQ